MELSRLAGRLRGHSGASMKQPLLPQLESWFASRGWQPFAFQREVWAHASEGRSGLLHCTTGAGKTLAVWGGALLRENSLPPTETPGVRILWITPLRALAADTELSLRAPLAALNLPLFVQRWTGDVSARVKQKVRREPPTGLVSTPESVSLLLSQPEFLPFFGTLHTVIVDEWHELLGTKRGVLTELALARLRSLNPGLAVWGLSATLGNVPSAAEALGGFTEAGAPRAMEIVRGDLPKEIRITTLLPPPDQRYPWAGHLGLQLAPAVAEKLTTVGSAIVFTNTRSQCELWFQALTQALPEWKDRMGIHHGSVESTQRTLVEEGLRSGSLRVVVATSSLDLGVDFSPVDLVFQVGSPKGVARLLQRAGRSGHQPGAPSEVCCVPANTFELLEITAARDLAAAGGVEDRPPLRCPLDVLCQHLLTVAAGSGLRPELLRAEVQSTLAYRDLDDNSWRWALEFVTRGGKSLAAYPEFARLHEEDGVWVFREEHLVRRHRMGIGTITADAAVSVRFANGQTLGSVEESFVSRLKTGDRFLFAGRLLQLVRLRDLRATVKAVSRGGAGTPRWMGGKMPLSTQLAEGVRQRLDEAAQGRDESEEMRRLRPLWLIQEELSALPRKDELLVESLFSREGTHLFVFPFEGRLVHEGLAALFSYRLGRIAVNSFALAVNDYGFELLGARPFSAEENWNLLLQDENLIGDILGSINAGELARRRFREIARIAGLTFEGFPGRQRKGPRQMQISSSLLYEVFHRYEPDHLLLHQATREVLEGQLEEQRLRQALVRLRGCRLRWQKTARPTPLAFPLLVERLREQLSTETLLERLRRYEADLESVTVQNASSRPSPPATQAAR
jgi:ATP-dependent Lhr-like helicase